MITVTFSGDPEQVHQEAKQFFGIPVAQLSIDQVAAVVDRDPKGLTETIKEEKAVKVEKVQETKTDPITNPPQEAPAKPVTAPTGDLFAAIQIVVPRVGKEKGRQGAVELLAKYGAKNGKEVKPADQAAFLAEANALLPEAMRVTV